MTSLDQLSFEFFCEFSRCEYCLMRVGVRELNRKDPTADWGAFTAEIAPLLEAPKTAELKEAVTYYSAYPPKKQVTRFDGGLDWNRCTTKPQKQN